MNVPNHEKKAFRDMTPEERSAIVEAKILGNAERIFEGDSDWDISDKENLNFNGIYRTRPRQLVIPWEVIKPEYKWAAMDSDCSLFVYDVEPNLSTHDWVRNGGLPECIDALNINTTGIDWRESLVQRPGKV